MNRRLAHPVSGLTALLDALERDLLASSAEEVGSALGDTGRARNAACQEVRSLLNEAMITSEDGSVVTPPFADLPKSGVQRH